jgi:hypothetical protein
MPHKDPEARKAYNKAYNATPERKAYHKAYNKAYGKAHAEELKAYRTARAEERKAYDKAYYATHREERRAAHTAYDKAHAEERRTYHMVRYPERYRKKYDPTKRPFSAAYDPLERRWVAVEPQTIKGLEDTWQTRLAACITCIEHHMWLADAAV